MKKVIITAANSFIGRRLCKKLAENGYFIYAVVRKNFSRLELFENINSLQLVYCDMDNYNLLDQLINDTCDIGIALAWSGTRGIARADVELQEVNCLNTMMAIKSFDKLGCKTIMTAGSQAEYGPWESAEKTKETDVCSPNTAYGKAKLELYKNASTFCKQHSIRLIEPRFFSLYGADDFEGTMIISMIRNMLQNRTCDLTQCIQLWDFLYIEDAIDALYGLLESDYAVGIYNFGSGISKPLKDYIEEMYRLTGSKSKMNYGAVPYPATGIVHTNPSIDKLKSEINWAPQISFTEGIEKVIAYQKEGNI